MVALLAGIALLIYCWRLGDVPAYLSIEEVSQARAAVDFASSQPVEQAPPVAGRAGETSSDPAWIYLAPAWVVLAAGVLKLVSFSETAIRLPSATAGVLDVLLVFFVARELFGRMRPATIAAALLMLTPAHVIQSRIASGQIGTVTATLAWLLFLARYFNSSRRADLVAAAICLGLGTYIYAGALIAMPLYFAVTLVIVWRRTPADAAGHLAAACGGFAAAFVPLAVWHLLHRQHLIGLATYYTHGEYNRNMGWTGFVGVGAISHIDTWWDCYSPDKLFFSGDSDLRFSTRAAGYFLLPVAVPLITGLAYAARRLPSAAWAMLASGLIVAPWPAALVSSSEIKRWLTFVPFAILVAAWGAECMLADRRRIVRAGAVAILLLSGFQGRSFLTDYFGRYRDASAIKFGGNVRGAIHEALSVSSGTDCVLLNTDVYYLKDQWDLYTRVNGRPDLATRATWLGPKGGAPAGQDCAAATVVGVTGDARFAGWRTIPIPELDGTTTLAVYRRDAQ
jgi:hypothetical protein